VVYFESRSCERRGERLGNSPAANQVYPLQADAGASSRDALRFCVNAEFDACGWLIPVDSPDTLRAACRHNKTIPDLSIEEKLCRCRMYYGLLLCYGLLRSRLPRETRTADPRFGLAFDRRRSPDAGSGRRADGRGHPSATPEPTAAGRVMQVE
jgi:hypothetical protein